MTARILALDAATEACTAALSIDGDTRERFELGGNHSERILPMVDALLAEAGIALAQLDAIAFGRGPGSFTGLRIAAGVTQGLAFGADLPVIPISSLAALAQGQPHANVLTAFDARMQQVYWAAYVRNAEGLATLAGEEVVVAPAGVPVPDSGGWHGAGSGWDQYAPVLGARLRGKIADWRAKCFPHAADVARLALVELRAGRAIAADQAMPVYIRDEVAKKAGSVI